MDEPEKLRDHLLRVKAQGFRAFKIGWGPFGRRNAATDEALLEEARALGVTVIDEVRFLELLGS